MVEPLAADVRGGSRREIRRKINTELLRLAAAMCGAADIFLFFVYAGIISARVRSE